VSAEVETEIRQLCGAASHGPAATRAIETYGTEIRRFLESRFSDPADADDAFAMFCEDLWSGLPSFAWRCSLRGWAYTIARHAELRFRAAPFLRRRVTITEALVAAASRTATAPYRRTDVKSKFRELRLQLGEEDQLILVLRVDRALGWAEIAHVLGASMTAPRGDLKREEARIRKRFQLIKQRLRELAAAGGLLPAGSSS
jgi:RNA polymerase sigma-70 factor (ECF subfamily)